MARLAVNAHAPTALRQGGAKLVVDVDLRLTGMWRFRIGSMLVKLGCRIMGLTPEVTTK